MAIHSGLKGLKREPQGGEPQQYSRNAKGIYLPGSLYSWGSLLWGSHSSAFEDDDQLRLMTTAPSLLAPRSLGRKKSLSDMSVCDSRYLGLKEVPIS